MKKTRIAIIINAGIGTGPLSTGCDWLREYCEYVAKEYDLIVFSFAKINDDFQPKGYQIVFSKADKIFFRFPYLFLKVLQLHFIKKFDIVHAFWGYPSGFLASILGKCINTKTFITFIGGEVANIPSINFGLFQSRLLKTLIQFSARNVDVVIAQTQYHAQKLKENLRFNRMETISFGIDLKKFPIAPKKLKAPYQFIYIGDFNRVKNLPMLLETFQKISKKAASHLTLVGRDTLHGEIQQLAQNLHIADKVTFFERRRNEEMASLLKEADILLLTSYWETHGLVANEAMASGVVVCGTCVGILADLANEITTVADIGDTETLAHKILFLLENSEKYYAFQQKGIAWSQENYLEAQCQKYSVMYKKILTP